MKRFVSILLLIFLLAPCAGAYLWLQHQKAQVRHQVKQHLLHNLPQESLTVLVFTHDEAHTQLRWEDAHEFEYQHHFYDLVRTETYGDTTWYWCWDDQKETHIHQQLRQLVAQATDQDVPSQETRKQLLHFFSELYCTDTFVWKSWVGSSCCSCLFPYLDFYTFYCISSPSPPPEATC